MSDNLPPPLPPPALPPLESPPHRYPFAPPPPPTSALPLNYAGPDRSRRGESSLLVRMLCWLVILLIVGVEVRANFERAQSSGDAPTDNPAMSAIAHCIVGAASILADQDRHNHTDSVAPLIEQMKTIAKRPDERLKLAIIAREVHEPLPPEDSLDALAASSKPATTMREDIETLRQIYSEGPAALSDTQRQTLIDHQRWFASVALSFGLPDGEATRAQMLAQAKRAFIASGIAVFVGAGVLGLALLLFLLAIVLGAMGKLPLRFRAGPADSLYLEAFAVYLAGFVVLSLILRALMDSPSIGWSLALTAVLPLAAGWPVIRGQSWHDTRQQLGWHLGRGVVWEMICGIGGYIAALPVLAVALLVTLQLVRLSDTAPSHPILNYLNGDAGQVALLYFLACVWAPVFEETMFRGALFNHLRGRHGWWVSAMVVGLLFAAVHPQGWTTIPVLGVIGMVLCGLREWRGSLIASMTAHALNNGTVLTLALLFAR
jgi:membrane protease YdiL (CAAX protease family)